MTALEPDKVIAVIGAGAMGAGIAQVASSAGHRVYLYDLAEGIPQKAIDDIRVAQQKRVERGRISEADARAMLDRLTATNNLSDVADAALVIEAIVEKLDVKRSVFQQLEDICGDQTILATNTSSLSVTALGAKLRKPHRLVGMHFFNPAPVMPLVEVISGLATDSGIAQVVFETAKRWGKKPVHARSTPGFIVNRVARPFYAEALRVFEEGGASIPVIDAVMKNAGGFRMGPFEVMDLIGQDINFAVTTSVYGAYFHDSRFLPSLVQQEYVDGGLLGRKSGRGFYDYSKDSAPVPDLPLEKPQPFPKDVIRVEGNLNVATPLVSAMQGAGLKVELACDGAGVIRFGDTTLAMTDGRPATQRCVQDSISNLVLFDLAQDFHSGPLAVLAAADQCQPESLRAAVGLFQALGKEVIVVDDIAGLIVMRTVCMIANEAADAVLQRVCDAQGCDTAMMNGANYSIGPLAWADKIGIRSVVGVLDELYQLYGLDRYRVSPLLRRNMYAGKYFLSPDL